MRCDICFDPEKGCNNKCKGKECASYTKCHRTMHPTIRITTKCTQRCTHCCFSCSPTKTDMMSPDKAEDIKAFLSSNGIDRLNIMGGEFYTNPEWHYILPILSRGMYYCRIVSNGDWASSREESEKIVYYLHENPNVVMGISKDKWHTNKHVEKAEGILRVNKVNYQIATEENKTKDESIVPVGRSSYSYSGLYSMFGCYCHNPQHKYSFLIDEKGGIYKCPFGMWEYDNISAYTKGDFAGRFKEVNKKFYTAWIANCQRCAEMYARVLQEGK